MVEKLFKLKENHTTVRTEVIAGITTFMTMAYILAVNPSILSAAGMDTNAILMATALAAFIGTFAMAFLANYPFALAPGLGLNAYFAYTVCGTMGYSWKVALLAVFGVGDAIDLSTKLNLPPVVSNIGSLVVFALMILTVLKFSLWRKVKKNDAKKDA